MSKTRELGSAIGIYQLFFYRYPRELLTNDKEWLSTYWMRWYVWFLDTDHLSELTEAEELEISSDNMITNPNSYRLKGYLYYDVKYIRPFFTRKFTQKELKDGKSQVTELTNKWFQDIQVEEPLLLSDSEEEFNQDQD